MTARRALVLGVTQDLAFAAGTFLAGWMRHHPGFDGTVVILHDELKSEDIAALSKLCPNLELRPYPRARAAARMLAAGIRRPARWLHALAPRSHMILAKFEMLDWLDRFDTVMWCDVDMQIQAPVPELWEAGPLAWRPLGEGAIFRRSETLTALAHLVVRDDVPLPNGGVIVAQAALRTQWQIDSDAAYAMTAALVLSGKPHTLDEMSLFLLATSRSLPVESLPRELNHPVASPGAAGARILHAIGADKFWNATPLRHAVPQWSQDHTTWIQAGGTPAPQPDRWTRVHPLAPDDSMVAARNRQFWLDLWRDLGPALPAGLWLDPGAEGPSLRLYATGHGRDLAWIELQRAPREDRCRIGLCAPTGSDRATRLGAIAETNPLAALGLRRHKGRRIDAWMTELRLERLPAVLPALRDALTKILDPTTTMPTALLVAHGAPANPEPQETALRDLARRVAAHLPGWRIEGATLAMPGALEAALAELGPQTVIYPFFMAQGWFTGKELPRRLDLAGAGELRQLAPFGTEPGLQDLIARIATQGATQAGLDPASTTLLLAAHGSKVSRTSTDSTEAMAATLRQITDFAHVVTGYVEQAPFLAEAARIDGPALCLPFFALRAEHVSRDVPEALEQAGFDGPLLPAIGEHPEAAALIAKGLVRGCQPPQ